MKKGEDGQGEKPAYLLKAEAEAERLNEEHAALVDSLRAGSMTQERYGELHSDLLTRQATVEAIVTAFRARWETFGDEDHHRQSPRRPGDAARNLQRPEKARSGKAARKAPRREKP